MKRLALLLLANGGLALGQGNLQVTAQIGGTSSPLAEGGILTLQAPAVGRQVLIILNVQNPGSAAVSIAGFQVTGSNEIVAAATPAFPLTVSAGGSVSFTVAYQASSGNRSTAQGIIFFQSGTTARQFSFSVAGTVPDASLAAFLNPDGALTPLASGSKVTFPNTALQASRTATFVVLNRGSAPSRLTAATVSGVEFQLSGVPALPATIAAGQDVRFTVRFTPQTRGTAIGTLGLTLDERVALISLEGVGAVPDVTLSYILQADGTVRPLANGGQISFLPTNLNSTAQAVVVIQNPGSAPVTLNSAALSGTGFQLTNVPLLPAVIDAGRELRVGVNFTPSVLGAQAGNLRLDFADRSFQVAVVGTTTTSELTVNYVLQADGNARPLLNGGVLSFNATSLNTSATAAVVISNQATGSGRVTGVQLTGTGFQLSGLPILPATVDGGRDLRFNVIFTPRQAGTSTATLRIDFPERSIIATVEGSTASADFTVSYVFDPENVVRSVTSGGQLQFPPIAANTTTQAALVISNGGSGAGVVNGVSVSGTAFQLVNVPLFPITVEPGRALRVFVQFAPRQNGNFTGSLRVEIDNRTVTATLAGSTAQPEYTFAYLNPENNNSIALSDLATLFVPSTQVDRNTVVIVQVANAGPGTGTLNNIAVSGTGYQLTELPTFPVTLAGGRAVRFGVRFSPTQQQRFPGTLTLELAERTFTIYLDGLGLGSILVYERTDVDPVVTLRPEQTVSFGDTPAGQPLNLTLQVRNVGSSEGQVNAITVTGTGFQIVDAPFVPFVLRVNETQRVTVRFSSQQVGTFTGRLRIGADSFVLEAVSAGPSLVYSYRNAGIESFVEEGGVVVLSPTRVGERSELEFRLENRGNRPAVIASIGFAAASPVFVTDGLPALPRNLEPNASLQFRLRFQPNNTGLLSGTLRVNTTAFTVSGTGTQPLALPEFRFQGATGGVVEPLQQPALGLTLAAPYPLPLRGTLSAAFVSDVFSQNPAVQFSSGGRTANFTIAANATQAVFEGGATSVRLQTGTVAGSIVVTPAFATQGGLELTPASVPTVTYTINRAAPRLLEGAVSARSNTAVAITLTGYSTTRTLRSAEIQITPRSGENLTTSRLTLNVESTALLYFQSAAAESFGGLFTLTIPLSLQGGAAAEDVVRRIQSITVTVANDVGASGALNVAVQ